MHLYALTLQKSTAIVCTAYGNFSAPKMHEIACSHGKVLELLRPDAAGKMQSICSMEAFGTIRSMVAFRLPGANTDYLVLGSDSGRISVLEFHKERNQFERVHMETFGKSGCRRIVPGQYIASDPKGRAVMLGAVEKQKFVYIFNRDATSKLTISSPLEAHKNSTINFCIVGVDVGFENPIFACIELDYTDADQDPTGEAIAETNKVLTFYELDLGLNHVVRKWSEPIDPASNMLIPVPGDTDGPSGVLVCAENKIAYKKPDHEDVVTLIPRRDGMALDQPLLITAYAQLKQKDYFFILLQSEHGDLYRVTLDYKEEEVSDINIVYFDTVPVATSLVILKTGFLFVASEFGNHALYQFLSIKGTGDEDTINVEVEIEGETIVIPHFKPHPLKNLLLVDDIDSMSPIVDSKILDLAGEETPQIYALCGRGRRSTLRTLRHGLAVAEMAVSELPSNPSAVWTVRASAKEDHDKYIVVSFLNATIVLSIGETVEEVTDSGFLATTSTLSVSLLGDDSLLQIHPNGIRRIRSDGRINEFTPPNKGVISKVAVNQRQVAIALQDNSIIYFELDAANQLEERAKPAIGGQVAAIDLAALGAGRSRSKFMVVGTFEATWIVRVLSLEPGNFMQVLSRQALPDRPESLCLTEIATGTSASQGGDTTLFLFVGLANGVLMRIGVDPVSGQLAPDFRTRFLGAKPVKLFKVLVQGQAAVLALSSRSWLCYNYQGRYNITPMSYETLEYAATFASEQCPEGFVSVAGNTLRILTVERFGEIFNQQSMKLAYTPRRAALLKQANCFVVLETDHNSLVADSVIKAGMEVEGREEEDEEEEEMPESVYGVHRAGQGRWASCIRVVDPVERETVQLIPLDEDEAALSVCTCTFPSRPGETFVVVGTVSKMALQQRVVAGVIRLYTVQGNQLTLEHKTPVEGAPRSVAYFQGRVLVGVTLAQGASLRMYDLGKKKLLRKCENRSFPNMIVNITVNGDRIYVADVAESIIFVKYNKTTNSLLVFADDYTPRWVTGMCNLDYDTVAAADKFGNIFVSRLPAESSDDVQGGETEGIGGEAGAAVFKTDEIIQYHVGETVCGLQKATLTPGGAEAILYWTLFGGIGALQAFVSREDVDFFTHLEMHLRGANGAREAKPKDGALGYDHPSICGRDQLAFRSSYFPVKDVIDGDLCEVAFLCHVRSCCACVSVRVCVCVSVCGFLRFSVAALLYSWLLHISTCYRVRIFQRSCIRVQTQTFIALDAVAQKRIADELDRTPGEVAKKLEDMRNRLL